MPPAPPLRTAPLALLCAGVAMAAWPLRASADPWALVLLAGCLASRLTLHGLGRSLPTLGVKLAVLTAGGGLVANQYGMTWGLEAGISLCIILVALKCLETRVARDFQVLILLSLFLALCAFFYSQDLNQAAWTFLLVAVLVSSMVLYYRSGSSGAFPATARTAGTLLLQAIPLAAVLFLLTPRIPFRVTLPFGGGRQTSPGMSDRMQPGTISRLVLRDALAFRADFPDGVLPLHRDLYWRTLVFWQGDELTWARGGQSREGIAPPALGGDAVRQNILLEPHGARWLVALDRPASRVPGSTMQAGGYLQSESAVITSRRYAVTSQPFSRDVTPLREELRLALRVPRPPSPAVKALVDQWRAGDAQPGEIVRRALDHFGNGTYSYTLEPGSYEGNELEEFVIRRRSGFCEHYAGAFASLMRVAGVPARVVVGYQGGEYNRLGGYILVNSQDAHAWCEAWIQGMGWLRIDPTAQIAPDRLANGFSNFLENQARGESGADSGQSARRSLGKGWRQAELLWDLAAFRWNTHVVAFDENAQRQTFAFLPTGAGGRWLQWVVACGVAIASVAALGWWGWRGRQPARDPVTRAYDRFCRKVAAHGIIREPWEAPVAFASRAADSLLEASSAIREIGIAVADLRYGEGVGNITALSVAVRRLQFSSRKRLQIEKNRDTHGKTL